MKRMYFKPCKFSCKTDDIKGSLRRLGYRNWWESLAGVENKNFDYDLDANNLKLALSKCRDNVCARIVLSGLAVTQVFASLVKGTPEPSLLLNDPTKVERTFYKHPNPQCRLDTYLSGANCDSGIDKPFDLFDPKIGACTKDQGVRPMCWFQEKDFSLN